jgi:hypothetical protein
LFLWTKIKLRTCLGALVLAKCIWYNLVNNLRRDVPWGQKCVTVHKRSGCYITGNAYIYGYHDQLTSSTPPCISFYLFSLFIYCASNLPFLFSISYIL